MSKVWKVLYSPYDNYEISNPGAQIRNRNKQKILGGDNDKIQLYADGKKTKFMRIKLFAKMFKCPELDYNEFKCKFMNEKLYEKFTVENIDVISDFLCDAHVREWKSLKSPYEHYEISNPGALIKDKSTGRSATVGNERTGNIKLTDNTKSRNHQNVCELFIQTFIYEHFDKKKDKYEFIDKGDVDTSICSLLTVENIIVTSNNLSENIDVINDDIFKHIIEWRELETIKTSQSYEISHPYKKNYEISHPYGFIKHKNSNKPLQIIGNVGTYVGDVYVNIIDAYVYHYMDKNFDGFIAFKKGDRNHITQNMISKENIILERKYKTYKKLSLMFFNENEECEEIVNSTIRTRNSTNYNWVWKRCHNYPNYYINKTGDVRSYCGKHISRGLYGDGHVKIKLERDKLLLYYVFIRTFIDAGFDINTSVSFIDGNKENICIENIKIHPNKLIEEYDMMKQCSEEYDCVWITREGDKILKRDKTTEIGMYLHKNYYTCQIKGKSIRVHNLIANAFLEKPENYVKNYHTADHMDNKSKNNNNVTNLRWASPSLQARNRTIKKNIKPKQNIMCVNKYDLNDNLVETYENIKVAVKKLQKSSEKIITENYIRTLCRNDRKKIIYQGKYIFKLEKPEWKNAVDPDEIWRYIEYVHIFNDKTRGNCVIKCYVSDKGNVKNIDGKILTKSISDHYEVTQIDKISLRVNRLIATGFHENPENKEMVNHKDLNKSNNNASNLEWATRPENVRHYNENKHKLSK